MFINFYVIQISYPRGIKIHVCKILRGFFLRNFFTRDKLSANKAVVTNIQGQMVLLKDIFERQNINKQNFDRNACIYIVLNRLDLPVAAHYNDNGFIF